MLRDELIETITLDGPMPFDTFQRHCLYHPHFGYYSTGTVRSSRTGDFVTSPEVSRFFGETIGRFVEAQRTGIETLIEFGAGSGSLMTSMTKSLIGDMRIITVEHSAAARRSLSALEGVEVWSDLEGLDSGSAIVVGNEVVDNIPVALAVRVDGSWMERWVGREGNLLVYVSVPARPEVAAWADRYGGPLPEGAMVEVQLEAGKWLKSVLDRVQSGALLLFDYGGLTEELDTRRRSGTLRTYRNHLSGPDPLVEPGAVDITADVDFAALRDTTLESGWQAEVVRQDDFLRTWGLGERLATMRQEELAAAADHRVMDRLALRSRVHDIQALLNPRGLGDFRVLVASK